MDPWTQQLEDGLELRSLALDQAAALYARVDQNRAYLRRWMPWLDGTNSADDVGAFIERVCKEAEDGRTGPSSIWVDGQISGVVDFHTLDTGDRSSAIGYWLSEDCQGRGLMTRVVRAYLDFGFDDMNLNRIEIRAAAGNVRSCAIAERIGFTREGLLRQAQWLYDHFVDLALYSMLAQDWRTIGNQLSAGAK